MSLLSNISLYRTILFITVFGWLVGCSPKVTKQSTVYKEDLSVHRPDYPNPTFESNNVEIAEVEERSNVMPTQHIKNELDSVLNTIILSKKDIRRVSGFSIQVYSGNNRDKAAQVRNDVLAISEEFNPKISYSQPNYKVKVGKYFSRIEANKDYVVLKQEFGQALLVPDKILIE